MPRPKDPTKAFAAGTHGLAVIYRAILDPDPAVQLAAARMAAEAARRLPDAIDEELRALGNARRRRRRSRSPVPVTAGSGAPGGSP